MSKLTFAEEQRFSKLFVIPLVILITVIILGLIIWNSVEEISITQTYPYGNPPQSNIGLAISYTLLLVFVLFLDWLIISAKLVTEINGESIRYRYTPFILRDRFIYWEDVEKAYVRKYKPIMEYGGWGIRFGFRFNNKALNIKGNYGLQLELKSGKKLLIGTQKPEEMKELLITLGKSGN